jgi:uncharacterized membrane protein YsdA (DUF1294 family)
MRVRGNRKPKIRFSARSQGPQRRTNNDALLLTGAVLFLLCVGAAVLAGKLPLIVLCLYLGASVVAFFAYATDKSAARNGERRTREATLHLISLAGGWPGALFAQKVLRHKSIKAEFQRVYWTTVFLNCAVLVWLFTRLGSSG